MRLEYPAGARMLVDYSGDKVPVLDPRTGEVSQAEVFVVVLGCSGMLYAEASASQDLPNWLMAHVHAFEAYGGVTEATPPDNVPRHIIGRRRHRHAAVRLEGVDMGHEPAAQGLVRGRLDVEHPRSPEHGHEDLGFGDLARGGVGRRAPCRR